MYKFVSIFFVLAFFNSSSYAMGDCVKGSLVGGLIGHFAKHTVVGAGVGCAVNFYKNKAESNNQNVQVYNQNQNSDSSNKKINNPFQ